MKWLGWAFVSVSVVLVWPSCSHSQTTESGAAFGLVDTLSHIPIDQLTVDRYENNDKIIVINYDGERFRVQGSNGNSYKTFGNRFRVYSKSANACIRAADHILWNPAGSADAGQYVWSENANWGNNRNPGPDTCGDPGNDSSHSHFERFLTPPDPNEGWVWRVNDPYIGRIQRFYKTCHDGDRVVYCKDLKHLQSYRQSGGYPVAEGCRLLQPSDALPPLSEREGHQIAVKTKFVDLPGAACGVDGTMENHPVLFISGCHTTVADRCKEPWSDAILALALPHNGLCERARMAGFTDSAAPLIQDEDNPERYVAWYTGSPVPELVANLPLSECRL